MKSTTLQIVGSPAERRIIINALADHVRALESNRRRAARGQSLAIGQGDDETADAYEAVQLTADKRIKAARLVQSRLTGG